MIKRLLNLFLLALLTFVFGCGDPNDEGKIQQPATNAIDKLAQAQLTPAQRDYVERFNVVAKDIRDFPPSKKNIEKYFHIYKSVANLEDAKIFLFGETHTHATNQLWSAAFINKMISSGDVVLFEGAQSGRPVNNLAEHMTTSIFAAREYEKFKSHKAYKSTAHNKITNQYLQLFYETKTFLSLDILGLSKGKGFFWDLTQGNTLHPDNGKRNESMVQTVKDNLTSSGRIFVIAGALHLPHYQFAHNMAYQAQLLVQYPHHAPLLNFRVTPGAKENEINDEYYDFWSAQPGAPGTDTRAIFEFLKDKDFAILIPKNLPSFDANKPYLPVNAR